MSNFIFFNHLEAKGKRNEFHGFLGSNGIMYAWASKHTLAGVWFTQLCNKHTDEMAAQLGQCNVLSSMKRRWWRRWRDNVWKKDCVNGFFSSAYLIRALSRHFDCFCIGFEFFRAVSKMNKSNDWLIFEVYRRHSVLWFRRFTICKEWLSRIFNEKNPSFWVHFNYKHNSFLVFKFFVLRSLASPLLLPLTCLSFVVCVCYAASFYTKPERQNTDNFTYTFLFQWSQVWKILWNWQKFRIFSVWKSREKNSTPSTDFKCKRLEEIKWGKNNLQIGVANTNMFVVLFSLLSIHTSRMWISNCDLLGYVSVFFLLGDEIT